MLTSFIQDVVVHQTSKEQKLCKSLSDKIKGHVATYLNVTTMRVAARAYRPRVASTAYGRAVRLPSDRPIPRCTETPYFAGPRYCWDDAKIYDLSIKEGRQHVLRVGAWHHLRLTPVEAHAVTPAGTTTLCCFLTTFL